ncbi:hypothetical protein GQ600_8244 [Phytophthora cactorum]|nr:hypothetical protein GQ600_8244 [Phytophthora cactorum]
MVQFVYNKGRVTTAASNRAFKIAAACCRSDILMFLLERADISLETLEMTFKSALRAKSFDLARLLHKTKRVLSGAKQTHSTTQWMPVFTTTVVVVMQSLSRSSATMNISRTAAEHAFTEGVDSGSVLLMKSVCNNRSISPALGAKMLVRAIRKEQFGVVNFLWGQSWI